jgi:outer membrane protein assembly factor BamB
MKSIRVLCIGLSFTSAIAIRPLAAAPTGDWPQWRGPTGDGQADPSQKVPTEWSETKNILWRVPIPGRGHSSPIVAGGRIYLTTADTAKEEQRVLCLDRANGKMVWDTVVHRGKLDRAGHAHTSQASATAAWDGERLYVNFLNDQAIYTTALDAAGKVVWQRRVGDFHTHMGFGSSPVLHEATVLVSADHKRGGRLAGLNKQTGEVVWQHDRPKLPNYASPAVLNVAGKTQMVIAGCRLVSSFDPTSGRKLWEIEGSTEETVVTAVTDGHRVFVGGGYPNNHVVAVEADGTGQIAWQHGMRLYVPSLLVREGHVYAVNDSGQALCWKSDTGDQVWKEKVDREFYASPVMVGSRIYATSLAGRTSVFDATPAGFKLIAQNQLGDEALASAAICGNRIYLRGAKDEASRQEYLWCIGN